MNRIKLFTLLLFFMFSHVVISSAQNTDLPQVSFKAHLARSAKLAKHVEYLVEQEQANKLENAKLKIQETIGDNKLFFNEATAKIYSDRDFHALWQDKKAEQQFIKEYTLLAVSGVSDQSAKALQQILNQPAGLVREILLTDSFLDYLYYSQNVAKNANQWLYNLGSYHPTLPADDLIEQWVAVINNNKLAEFVQKWVPTNHLYQQTKKKIFELAKAQQAKAGNNKTNTAKKTVSEKANNLTLFYKLALNLQRLRIIPTFSNGIFVNIPSYQLFYFRDNQLVLQSKVIVGRNDRRTPVMYSKLSDIVVNPPWYVPTSIFTKDLIPKLAKDPSYAERSSLEIIDRSGNKISAESVDWSEYLNAQTVPFRVRQKAGEDSALGRFKFNMPSSDAIYLHDTPHRSLFANKNRALSSGCVRVERSDDLATILLTEAGWSAEKKQNVLASQKTVSAPILSDNPVYLYYVTAWVEKGKIYTLPDIYQYDVSLPNTEIDWAKLINVI
ncbi:L,D-transpeptidase family protein [[Haemophilus] ducreyi]|uniref:L,D-transpeptidase family protein n=1 Tax=Haemophilus ducreyi TaxID=730 RepID=UPI0006566EF9|nr:L,D-transpeptidase family protein [[Haemophilus] ducreyi]AKO45350.1 L,D-transpeptidase [[Haemophilus] ducreyi]AKO46735.1 L,D-transpeptidase [[Haemophilus] ducreyi]OOS03963.1 L,D-transpeptidase [[Haemophilus] ducreyi]SEV80677.1 L,D-transpeptidase catalytic domain [[Haemophilus] ducreyi]VEG83925.1 carboxypeptidase [[Haemophilus] ducreyi]